MAIKFNKEKNNNSSAIKDNEGFTFILQDDIEGFGFISLTENADIVITVTAIYDNGVIDQFSTFIDVYGNINAYSSIKDFLEEYFDYDIIFIKEYKHLEDMNIIVDLEVE